MRMISILNVVTKGRIGMYASTRATHFARTANEPSCLELTAVGGLKSLVNRSRANVTIGSPHVQKTGRQRG
jgi:hypothetical protein